MTDREMLELAALAAGYEFDSHDDETGGIYVRDPARGGHRFLWRPRTDGGDALRLAVKLRFEVDTADENDGEDSSSVYGCIGKTGVFYLCEPHNGDPLAATCRAIVRAAAEIGKAIREGK